MNIKFLLPLLLIMASFSSSHAQMRFFNEAEEVYKAGQFYKAVDMYRDAYDKIQGEQIKAEIVFKIAECYRKSGQPRKAELWYNKAISKEYDNPLIYLYHANALKTNEKFEEAIENYKEYQNRVPDDERGQMGIESCRKAQQWKENPNGYKVSQLRFVNSTDDDFSPAYSKAEYNEIYFTSSREESTGEEEHGATGQFFTDIFYSQKDMSGRWSDPEPISSQINTEVEEGSPSFTGDYNTLYFTRCEVDRKEKLGCRIYRAEKDNGEWDKPEPITLAPDSMVVAHPSISDDGSTLYFVSNIDGGYGQMDIWKVNRKGDQGWSAPINLGSNVNTPGNEMFPFIHSDGTLYFSSDFHLGMGGLDIFKATVEPNGNYKVENMRYPINSTHDDFGIVFEKNKERGFFSSARDGDDEIYSFVLPPLKFSVEGIVKNKKTEEPIEEATVKLVGSDGMTMSSETGEEGTFKFMLRPETDYVFVASKKKYLTNKGKASTVGLEESKVFEPEILLSSIEEPIELPNIFYDYNKWSLRDESRQALDKLVETLNDNPRVIIELRAHTDFRGEHWFNVELSTKRAESVVNYLIDHGINPDRLRAKGFAATQPKEIDQKMAARHEFLDAGDVLTESFIKELETEEQKEEAHQINRRTEFKVIATDFEP